ncbi:hypothetical protein, partial [Klebsiella pneumoniae]|uniref:hypothetical protein n=1 Tax=Klebsiella pneumoniae TaxID=573 RepID=UPI003013D621
DYTSSNSQERSEMQQENPRKNELIEMNMEIGDGKEKELWGMFGDDEFEKWMVMMDYNGTDHSSDSGSGNVHSV